MQYEKTQDPKMGTKTQNVRDEDACRTCDGNGAKHNVFSSVWP